jgi:hypothetical protein
MHAVTLSNFVTFLVFRIFLRKRKIFAKKFREISRNLAHFRMNFEFLRTLQNHFRVRHRSDHLSNYSYLSLVCKDCRSKVKITQRKAFLIEM